VLAQAVELGVQLHDLLTMRLLGELLGLLSELFDGE